MRIIAQLPMLGLHCSPNEPGSGCVLVALPLLEFLAVYMPWAMLTLRG